MEVGADGEDTRVAAGGGGGGGPRNPRVRVATPWDAGASVPVVERGGDGEEGGGGEVEVGTGGTGATGGVE